MFNALKFVLGIYVLSILVTLMVWLVIVTIRWLSSERPPAKTAAAKAQA